MEEYKCGVCNFKTTSGLVLLSHVAKEHEETVEPLKIHIDCARVSKKEPHKFHGWELQPEDDSQDIRYVVCFGYPQ